MVTPGAFYPPPPLFPPPLYPPPPPAPPRRIPVPWTWTDLLFFLPLALVFSLLFVFPLARLPLSTAFQSLLLSSALYAAMFVSIFLLVHFRRKAPLSSLGLRLPTNRWWLLAPIPLTFFGLVLTSVLQIIIQFFFPGATSSQCVNVQQEFPPGPLALAFAILAICVVAPFTEEILFRGFLFGWLRAHLPTFLALLLAGLIFGLAHAELILIIPLGSLGVLLAYVYHRSGSLVPGMLTHALFNLIGVLVILNTHC